MTSTDWIDREAREAAAADKTPDDACAWPFFLPEGQRWLETYHAERQKREGAAG